MKDGFVYDYSSRIQYGSLCTVIIFGECLLYDFFALVHVNLIFSTVNLCCCVSVNVLCAPCAVKLQF